MPRRLSDPARKPRSPRSARAWVAAVTAVAFAVCLAPRAVAVGARGSSSCASPAVQRNLRHALAYARDRYRAEVYGLAAEVALRRVAADQRLLHALRVHDLAAVRAEAQRLLVGHLVRLRVVHGRRVLVDANASSFAIAGPSRELTGPGGRQLGRLTVTVQDVIGFVKLVRRHAGAYALVRGARGQLRTLLPGAPPLLAASGCVRLGASRYAFGSFAGVSFSGETLAVWILVPAS